jgi:proteasome accessory factor B
MTNNNVDTPHTNRSRSRLDRIYRIHREIQSGKFPNCNKLAPVLGVTPKTIQRDIDFMRCELEMPLEYHSSEYGFHYSRPVSELPFITSDVEDLVALFVARKALAPLSGTQLQKTLSHSFQKLTRSMQGQVTFHWSDLDEAFSVRDTGVALPDVLLFDKLARAVLECRKIRFAYRNLGASDDSIRRIHPFHLAEVDGGWYVIGHDLERQAKRTFALQRMKDLRVLDSRFARPTDFNLRDHLGNSFSVWKNPQKGGGNLHIRVRMRGWAASYVPERRWHPSQQIRQTRGKKASVDVLFQLDGLEEITRWVLSWGALCTVIEPEELRARVKSELQATLETYPT